MRFERDEASCSPEGDLRQGSDRREAMPMATSAVFLVLGATPGLHEINLSSWSTVAGALRRKVVGLQDRFLGKRFLRRCSEQFGASRPEYVEDAIAFRVSQATESIVDH